MKKYILGFILTALIVFGCRDEFLEGENKGALSDDAVNNADGLDLLLTAAYSALDGQVGAVGGFEASGDNWWSDVLTDDAHKGSTNGDQAILHDLQTYNWTTGNSYFFSKWQSLYAGVNRANAAIILAERLKSDMIMTESMADKKIAEARFLRGHFNFELTRMYGNVAYIDEIILETNPDVVNEGPLWKEIEKDFQFAIDNLEDANTNNGRANAMAARAYLGKVYLYQEEWEDAETLLDAVIASGNYLLNGEFVDNFNAAGKNGNEAIFSIQFEAGDGAPDDANGNIGGTLNFPGGGPFGSCCGFYQPSQDLANAFKTASGLPEITTYSDTDITNDYGLTTDENFTPYTGELDPRIDYTIGRRGIDYNGFGEMIGFDWVRAQADAGPYLPKKNVYKKSELSSTQGFGPWGQQHAGLHYNVIRYADVLLMAAEAKAEIGGKDGDAMDLVNMVRARAKTSTYVKSVDNPADPAANYSIEPYTAANFTDPIAMIRFERRLELSMEGHRLFDLRRWGVAQDVINTFFTNEKRTVSTMETSSYAPKHNLFPIPLRAIDVSENLKQNPMWGN